MQPNRKNEHILTNYKNGNMVSLEFSIYFYQKLKMILVHHENKGFS